MPDPVILRPHHVLCALGYEGKGYSSRFTANMTRIVDGILRADDGDDVTVRITEKTDDICAPCPKRLGTCCTSQIAISALDSRHAAALDLSDGLELTWGEAQQRVRDNVQPDDLQTLCRGCQWLPMGMCTSAVERLHARLPASGGDI
ncbi:DUF1284 domain-containing protein [Pontivivens insulae]|uniref:DUF1284 domain-containing protein n=1 Tax=Pontivivens insulae TaxID=1639689 RepID=A0A2R8ABS5_9RHOB|nr:DUF1284 domain-containing protein [Pontivivens insulae]RED11319.1 hypothetical protein DFR53_3354 [Pontivivens insulae]SPF29508.1 hypothetical protein POI8812_01819 [Pontivivens insulae]